MYYDGYDDYDGIELTRKDKVIMRSCLTTICLLMLWGICSSCSQQNVPLPKNIVVIAGEKYELVEEDGCEYFHRNESYNRILTHKGNCKNPIHGYNR
jgi:hypothetical protein